MACAIENRSSTVMILPLRRMVSGGVACCATTIATPATSEIAIAIAMLNRALIGLNSNSQERQVRVDGDGRRGPGLQPTVSVGRVREADLPEPHHRGSSTRHGVGSQPDRSGIFLNGYVVAYGCVRYCGSVTIEVTTSQLSPFGSV